MCVRRSRTSENLAGIFHDVDESVKNFHATISSLATVSTERSCEGRDARGVGLEGISIELLCETLL
jgi:hypothetical protein